MMVIVIKSLMIPCMVDGTRQVSTGMIFRMDLSVLHSSPAILSFEFDVMQDYLSLFHILFSFLG